MPKLEVQVRRDAGACDELASDWLRLWQAQPRREVFTKPAWCLAAWQADGKPSSIALVCVRRRTQLVGLLPLMTEPVRFLSGVNSDYNDMLVDCSDADAPEVVASALQAVLREFGQAVLDNLPEWSTLCRVLDRLPEELRKQIVVEQGQPCPALRLGAERESLLASMSGKQSLKRHEKKLARQGALHLWHAEDRQAIVDKLEDFFAQHIARRALAGGRSLFLEERSRRFYLALLEHFDPSTELRFAVLEVDGRAVAYHLGFEVDGRFTWYKPSFDVDYWDCGVGEVLLKRLLEYVRDRPVHEFDFTRGDEGFKERFSNHRGLNVRWTLQRGGIAAQRMALQARVRQAMKAHPAVAAARWRWREMAARLRPVPGSRPGRSVPRGVAAWAAGLLDRDRGLVLLSADRAALMAGEARPSALRIEGVTLKTVALLSVQARSLFDLEDLRRMREALADGDRIFVGHDAVRPPAVAWIGSRVAYKPLATSGGEGEIDLGPSAAVIQFVGNAWPATDGGQLRGLILAMAASTNEEVVWIACPARASDYLSALREMGFSERRRGGGSRSSGAGVVNAA
jgi:CelD/BcsL family acetyltransferase involved in cellulose biosynthesis